MISSNRTYFLILVALLVTAILVFYPYKRIDLVLLTWEHEDTSHTMTVNYLTDSTSQTSAVYYDTTPQNGDPTNYRYNTQGELRTYPGVNFSVHSTQLTDLDPDKTYYFIVGDETTGYSSERKFRTMPLKGDIRFVSGGDASASETFEKICKLAAQSNPHFSIIGGDLAYANGNINLQQSWLDLLDIWQQTMVTPDGYTIPVIAAIGNHEVDASNQPPHKAPTQSLFDNAPFYHMIFRPAADKTFFKRRIGTNSILFVLDTDHIYPSDGEQLIWMKENFEQHKDDSFRFASYHVPLYPSFYDPDDFRNALLRNNWLNVFDQHHLNIAFENHDHTLKLSKLLKENQVVDSQGTIYIGDGNWGMPARPPTDRWYLEGTRQVNHVWSITLNEQTASFKALTIDGVDQDFSFEISTSN